MNNRLSKLKNKLNEQNLDALLISSPSLITYLTNYSGFSIEEREAFLLIAKNKQYVITDGRYSEAVVEKIPHFELVEMSPKKLFKNIFKELAKKYHIKKLGFESNNITVSEYRLLKSCYNTLVHVNTSEVRLVKDNDEIKYIEEACKLGDKTFEHILKKIKKGISEKELAFELEFFIKKNHADISFKPIIAFGKNSSVPHHQTNNQKLKTNNIVLLDFGVRLNSYCSDMTRTVFFGKPTAEQKKMYNTVLEAQRLAIEQLNNETMASRIDKIAREHITSQGYPTIPHSLGHGIGIEVHEAPRLSPRSKDILKPGMVFSIEPGIYLQGFGGVRIEDLVVLEKKGPRLLTYSPMPLLTLS